MDTVPSDDASELEAAIQDAGYEIRELGEIKTGVRGVSAKAHLSSRQAGVVRAFVKLNREDEDCFRRESAWVRLGDSLSDSLAVPKLLLVCSKLRLIIWEDISPLPGIHAEQPAGHPVSLGDLLRGDDRTEAATALAALTRSLAALHLATAPHKAEGEPALLERAIFEAEALREGEPKIAALLTALGATPSLNLETTVGQLADEHEAQGPLIALTHGDQAASNVLWKERKAWLVDFEFAAFRPMLYDLATWAVICPLPAASLDSMLSDYRSALLPALPWAGTPAFERSWAFNCAFRSLSMATWFGEGLAERNGVWGDAWDRRSAFITAVSRAAEAANGIDELTNVHGLVSALAEAAQRSWKLKPLRWPALS